MTPTATDTPGPDETPPEAGAGRIYAPYVGNRALAGNGPAAVPALVCSGAPSGAAQPGRPHAPGGVADEPACQELIRNGGFETGDLAEWTATGARRVSGVTMHDGISAAMLGGRDNASDSMHQALVLPDGSTSLVVSFWYYVTSDDIPGSEGDVLYADLEDGDGTLVDRLYVLNRDAAADHWQQAVIDLTGRTRIEPGLARLAFYAATDGSAPTTFAIDDVSVLACSPTFCTDVWRNGGFETGDLAGWTSSGTPRASDDLRNSGRWSAVVGGRDDADDALYQEVSLPADASGAQLSYWTHLTTQETGTTPTDYLFVEVLDPQGGEIATLGRLDNTSPPATWTWASTDLASGLDLLGRTVRVSFRGRTNDADPTTFHLDDVELRVCRPVPPPLPTATPTWTPTTTDTPSTTPTDTLTPTPTATATGTATVAASPTGTASATPTVTTTPTPTATPTPAARDTDTPTPARQDSPTPTPTAAPSDTPTVRPAPSRTAAPSPTSGFPRQDVWITDIEVTQGLQTLANTIDLVAGKTTWARVYVRSGTAAWKVIGDLGATRDGVSLGGRAACHTATARPGAPPEDRRAEWASTINCPLPAAWLDRPGTLEIDARVVPDQATDPVPGDNAMRVELAVEPSPPMHYDIVEVRDGGFLGIGAKGPSLEDYKNIDLFTEQMYPVARVISHSPRRWIPWLGDLGTLAALGVIDLLDRDPGPNTVIVGVVRPDAWSIVQGGMGLPSRHVWVKLHPASYDYAAAHETGHGFGLGHVDACGAFWPPVDSSYPYPVRWFSAGGPRDHWGLFTAFGTPLVMHPREHPDIMTYCPSPWISPHMYQKLRRELRAGMTVDGRGSDVLATSSEAVGGGDLRIVHPAQDEAYVVVVGYLAADRTSATLLPPMHLAGHDLDPAAKVSAPGRYTLQLRGPDGIVLAEVAFGVPEGSHAPESTPFYLLVPYHPDTARLVVLDGTRELASVVASAHAPTIQVAPISGEVPDVLVASWTATDTDGDDLTATVRFSPNGGATWEVAVYGLEGRQAELDTRFWPATQTGMLKVVVTDGLHTTEVTTGPFTVRRKPPSVYVVGPDDGAVLPPDTAVGFAATASDADDGPLPDEALAWRSSRQGALGTGTHVGIAGLQPGWHDITVTATDSEGRTASDSVRVYAGYRVILPTLALRSE